jgi:8-oxo-dGTP diphosphatase
MTSFNTATPRIASYVLLEKDGKYAFLKRSNTGWRDGFYALPAGKVEDDESYVQAAVRELQEELGVTSNATNLSHCLTCHRCEDGSDWVDIIFKINIYEGQPRNAEPNKHSELTWFALDQLPEDITPSLGFMLNEYSNGKTYAEYGWPA